MKQCVYCVVNEGTTRDHIPPRVCFTSANPNLVTVPACVQCNHEFSKTDDFFASLLSLSVGMDTPGTAALHEKNKRMVRGNPHLRKAVLKCVHEVAMMENGRVVDKSRVEWPTELHDAMARRIIRGLFFKVFKRVLPLSIPIHGVYSKPFSDPDIHALWSSIGGKNIGEEGDFRFRCAYSIEHPDFSCWMMIFYDRHFISGSTGDWSQVTGPVANIDGDSATDGVTNW